MPSVFLNEYGVFFTGQILDKYVYDKGVLRFQQKVKLEKFIIHYFNNKPQLYFRFSNFRNKQKFTINTNQLGYFYKIPRGKRLFL